MLVGPALLEARRLGEQFVHRPGPEPARVDGHRARTRRRRPAGPAGRRGPRPARRRPRPGPRRPRSRTRRSRTAIPAAASAARSADSARSTRASRPRRDRDAVGDPAGQAGGGRLVPGDETPVLRGGPDLGLGQPGVAQRRHRRHARRRPGYPAGSRRSRRRRWCRSRPSAMPAAGGDRAEYVEQLGLAEVAAVPGVGAVALAGHLVGGRRLVPDAEARRRTRPRRPVRWPAGSARRRSRRPPGRARARGRRRRAGRRSRRRRRTRPAGRRIR